MYIDFKSILKQLHYQTISGFLSRSSASLVK